MPQGEAARDVNGGATAFAAVIARDTRKTGTYNQLNEQLAVAADAGAKSLAAVLGKPPGLENTGIAEITGDDFLAAQDANCIICSLSFADGPPAIHLAIEAQSIDRFIAWSFGGAPSVAGAAPQRPPAEIDMGFARLLLDTVAPVLMQYVPMRIAGTLEPGAVQLKKDLKSTRRNRGKYLSTKWDLMVDAERATFEIAIALGMLEIVKEPDADQSPNVEPPKRATQPQPVARHIAESVATLTAILDEQEMLLGDVAMLTTGAVIPLNAGPSSRIRVDCDGSAVMSCSLGKSSGAYMLKVEAFVSPEQDLLRDAGTEDR